MIFAAGFGTRLANLVKDEPKPLIKVGNTTLLDHALDVTREAGITNIVVNAHYLSHRIVDHLASSSTAKVIIEEPDILDTGGGLLNALPHLGTDPVFTLNSDNYWFGQNPLTMLADYWNEQEMDALLILGARKNTFGYQGRGDFVIDSGGNLTRRSNQDIGLVYLGAQLISPSVISSEFGRVFSLNAIWDRLIHNKRIKGLIYDGKWAVIDTPYGIEIIRKIL
ncbi:MAG: nucleotidyltransferase family protein [Rhodobacteraceae bacterium]|nr:nucleotidyltransferase family protein [Paracoccaceae bacterium]MYG09694.1 nucleotidyltransferase family protein [Paracoccaceae bacterium]MYI91434.1 nucleotidyltransferase family protein [Paracoccaceae bacterium]